MLDGAGEERDGGAGLLVGEDFDVGQAGVVVDGDVHELPADLQAPGAGGVGDAAVVVVAVVCGDALAVAVLNAAELLDVDMDQLAGPCALVAHRGHKTQAPEFAHPRIRVRTADTVDKAIAVYLSL